MWLLSSLILFMGCPTPPDQVSSNTAQGPKAQGPKSGSQNGAQGTPQGNPNATNNGNTPNGQPSMGNGPDGSQDNGNKNQNGENGQPSDPDTQTADPNLDPENKSGEGSEQADGDGEEAKKEGEKGEDGEKIDAIPTPEGEDGGVVAVQIQGEPPPQNAEPTPVTESLLIRVERIPSKGAKPKHKQEQLANEDHITLTGTTTCTDCEGPLVLRVVRFLGPNDNHSENNLLTQKTVESGDFSILVPEGETPIALELLVDKNEDGQPSANEYFAVIEMAGQLIPDKSRSELNLDSTKRDFFAPAPIPGTQGPQ